MPVQRNQSAAPAAAPRVQEQRVSAPAPAQQSVQNAQASAPSSTGQNTEYKPSEDVLMRVNRLPKDEIRKLLGFDIGYLVKNTRSRGVLEALAYGGWTPPIHVAPSWKNPSGYISCRIWQSEGKDGKFKWGIEDVIPIATRVVTDNQSNTVLNDNGKPKMEFDRNELTVTATKYTGILYEGKPLSRDQVLHLKLTGHLGEPMTRVDPVTGKTVTEIVDCHPYNNQRIIRINSDVVRARLKRDPTFRTKKDTFQFTDRQIAELSLGRGMWVGSRKDGNCAYVQYDVTSGKLRFANEYSEALRKFNVERQRADEKAEMLQSMTEDRSQQATQSHGIR